MTITPHLDTHLDLKGLEALRDYLTPKLGQMTEGRAKAEIAVRELTLTVPAGRNTEVLTLLHSDPQCLFHMLIDVTAVDWLGARDAKQRFDVVYHLLSTTHNRRIRVKCTLGEGEPIATATGLFAAANWFERETWDMFGIPFAGHPDLRRLLTDVDFNGHPLRKDFPLEGHVEAYYDAQQQRVAYKPVDLPQPFRHFDRQSPWVGMTGNAPLADADKPFTPEEFK